MLWSRISFSSASSQSSARCLYQSVASSSSISDVIAWCMASVSLLSRSRGACNPSLDIQSSFEVKNGGAANIRSEEHTSELQSLMRISYAVFCLKNKKLHNTHQL